MDPRKLNGNKEPFINIKEMNDEQREYRLMEIDSEIQNLEGAGRSILNRIAGHSLKRKAVITRRGFFAGNHEGCMRVRYQNQQGNGSEKNGELFTSFRRQFSWAHDWISILIFETKPSAFIKQESIHLSIAI